MFIEQNKEKLAAFAKLSSVLGSRPDYVQGGGGNTSVKLDSGLMAIKASGFCLKDIREDHAYAILDCKAISAFYADNEPADLTDVEKEGAACTKANTKHIDGLDDLRPSVEAGFHSILKTFVGHTHSVYANLACCSKECRDIAAAAFKGADYTWGWVPYTDPGANLTFAIRDELARVAKETGKTPSVILMQNHGIIAHDDDAEKCVSIHADANERLASAFGLHDGDFPKVAVKQTGDGLFEDDTPFLREMLSCGKYPYSLLMTEPLYPDQMVFLADTFYENEKDLQDGTCSMDPVSGAVTFRMTESKALVIAETLTAVTFIMEHVKAAGYELSTMGEAAKDFIANWESEKYRKSLAGKK